jgi:hypothetical protein
MPYITQKDRENTEDFPELTPLNPGELNFLLTKVCLEYLSTKLEHYGAYNDVVGALECCKLEFYRRKIEQYEDRKIKENGDVY